MNLADISQEAFGYNVLEFGMENLDAPTPEPMSPSKSRVFGSGHKRTRSNGIPAGEQPAVFFQQAETMHDLEVLILAFDALEDFALTWEKLDKYVLTYCPFLEQELTSVETVADAIRERRRTFWRHWKKHWMRLECTSTRFLVNGSCQPKVVSMLSLFSQIDD